MSLARAPLEPDAAAPQSDWFASLAAFIAWLAHLFEQVAKLKRIRRTTKFKPNWRDHWDGLHQLEWMRDQVLAPCAARLLAGETLDAESDFIPSTEPPADYGGPCPKTPFEMNRRFLAIARFNADPEVAIRAHSARIAKRAGVDLSNPLAAHGSTDATLRIAAHHERASADTSKVLILSSAGRARPSKDERVLAHARGLPQPTASPHVIANSLTSAHRDGDHTRLSALDKTVHGAIVRP